MDIYYGFNLTFPYQVVSAKVNNRSEGLNFKVYNNKDIEFLDVTATGVEMPALFTSVLSSEYSWLAYNEYTIE